MKLGELLNAPIDCFVRVRCWLDESYPVTCYEGYHIADTVSDDDKKRTITDITPCWFMNEACLFIDIDNNLDFEENTKSANMPEANIRPKENKVQLTNEYGEKVDAVLVSEPDAPYLEYEYKVITKRYNPNFGDNRVCVCGHTYYRHFDPDYDMEARGCKYCGCENFVEKGGKEDVSPYRGVSYIKTKDDALRIAKEIEASVLSFNNPMDEVSLIPCEFYLTGEMLDELDGHKMNVFAMIRKEKDEEDGRTWYAVYAGVEYDGGDNVYADYDNSTETLSTEELAEVLYKLGHAFNDESFMSDLLRIIRENK